MLNSAIVFQVAKNLRVLAGLVRSTPKSFWLFALR